MRAQASLCQWQRDRSGEAAYFAARLLARPSEEEVVDCQNFPYLSCFSAKSLQPLEEKKSARSSLSPGMRSGETTGMSTWEKRAIIGKDH